MSTIEPLSKRIRRLAPTILMTFELRARREVSESVGQTSLALEDSLPDFILSLADKLSISEKTQSQANRESAKLDSASREHGRSRSEMPMYFEKQVLLEYQILREIIIDEMNKVDSLDRSAILIIFKTVENAATTAITEFSNALWKNEQQNLLRIIHDLRNPISAAKICAEVILRGPINVRVQSLLNLQIKSMDKMIEMIEELLQAGQIRSGKGLNFETEECNLEAIIFDVITEMKLIHDCEISISTVGPTIGYWNREYLRRTLENLIENSIKYRTPETPIQVSVQQSKDSAIVKIHNEGEPITPAEQAILFRPFQRGTSMKEQKGWGLGLSLVKAVVDALDGSIEIESTAESGTTFVIQLPKNLGLSDQSQSRHAG